MDRRSFLKASALAAGGLALPSSVSAGKVFWPPGVFYKFATMRKKRFALTIDDGWRGVDFEEFVGRIDDNGWKATWFLNGTGIRTIRDAPSAVDRIIRNGHSVAYHTIHHPSLEDQRLNYDASRWVDDWHEWFGRAWETFGHAATFAQIPIRAYARAAGGYFSPPFMDMCKQMDLLPVAWSSDPWYINRGTHTKSGDIMLFHVRHSDRKWVDYVVALIEQLGLLPVDLTEALEIDRRTRRRWELIERFNLRK